MADPSEAAKAILARCELMKTTGPTLPVAMPDVAFIPPTNGRYLRVDLFNNAPFWQGLTSGRIDQGLLQVTVVWPKNAGIIRLLAAAEAVKAHFPKGLTLYGPGVRVRVTGEPWAATPIIGDTDTETPVTIPWRV